MKITKILAALVLGFSTMTAMADDTKFDGHTLFGFCSTPKSAVTLTQGDKGGAAMQLNAEYITYFQGCRITAIAIANGAAAENVEETDLPITLFVTNGLNQTPITEFESTMDMSKPLEYKEYALPEPIEITAETTPLYFGFKYKNEPEKYSPIVVDVYDPEAGPSDWIGAEINGVWAWEQLGSQVGMNCIRVRIEGTGMLANKVAMIGTSIPTYIAPGQDMEVGMYLENQALNEVTSVTVNYTFNNGETQSTVVELNEPLIYNEYTLNPVFFNIDAPETVGTDIPVKIELAGINGTAANGAAYVHKNVISKYHCFDGGFDKNVVAEVATGTWCGFCPRGIVALNKMAEYDTAGRFIPIAVHVEDEMTTSTYTQFTGLTGGSAPCVVINRDVNSYGAQSPSFEHLKSVYDHEITIPSLVKPSVTNISFDEAKKKLNVDASVEFAVNATGDYAFAYVIVEDQVGPYAQTNYYSPAYNAGMELEWWDEQGPSVSMKFDAVARYIYSYRGVSKSIPATVEANQTYTHSAAVATNTVSNIDNCSVVLLIINRSTNRIENAVKVPYKNESAIESVEVSNNNEPAIYFDLQGRSVATPTKGGIYVELRGNESKKIRF